MFFDLQKIWNGIYSFFRKNFGRGKVIPYISVKNLESTPCKMLCIDDDVSFCTFIQRLAHSFGIQMDIAHSIQVGKKAIENEGNYQSFIVDGHLPDGSGFELVAWIREKKGIKSPIAFISRIYQDATSFRLLKESLSVNFILDKPIQLAEVQQLFIQLCQLVSIRKNIHELFSEELLWDLKNNYQKTIPDKMERLEKMILDVQKKASVENLEKLKGEVHKIGGSAGSYGYMGVSELCKNLEHQLVKHVHLAKQQHLNSAQLELLDDFFAQIKLHFQMKVPQSEIQNSLKRAYFPTVYVVDEQKEFLEDFVHSLQDRDFDILTETQPDQAIQTLLVSDFYPELLFFNEKYSSSSLTGYDLLRLFFKDNDELTSIVSMMVNKQSIENQAEALKNGVSFSVLKPFSPSWILPLLDSIPFKPLPIPFKVVVIDNDEDICHFIIKILKNQMLDVKAFHQVSDLEKIMKEEHPDLILLDINLTDQAGEQVLQQLREKWKYQNLLVGMLSLLQQETHLLQECYDANIDDILFKPLERGVVQRKMTYLLKKKAQEKLSIQSEDKLRWIDEQTFEKYFNQLQSFSSFYPRIFIIFQLEKLSHSDEEQKTKIIHCLTEALEHLLKRHEIAVCLDNGSFGLLFQGVEPSWIQLAIRHFLFHVQNSLKECVPNQSFSIDEALLVVFERESNKELLDRAEKVLNNGKKEEGREAFHLLMDPSYSHCKEVFLFQDEAGLFEDLLESFKNREFKTNILFSEEGDKIRSLQKKEMPLFILTGSFAKMKGISLIKKLINIYPIQFPIIYLPNLAEKDFIRRLFDEIDYFQFPFGLVIIISD